MAKQDLLCQFLESIITILRLILNLNQKQKHEWACTQQIKHGLGDDWLLTWHENLYG